MPNLCVPSYKLFCWLWVNIQPSKGPLGPTVKFCGGPKIFGIKINFDRSFGLDLKLGPDLAGFFFHPRVGIGNNFVGL